MRMALRERTTGRPMRGPVVAATGAAGGRRAAPVGRRRFRRAGGSGGLRASSMARAAALSVNQVALIGVYRTHSAGSDSSGKIALTGHSGSQAPQSMHSFGSMYSVRSVPCSKWMQSTGQTATHAWSITSTHGSAIT